MSLKGKNLEGIGNNGIEINTQEGQENTSNIGKNKVVASLVLWVLLWWCISSKWTNTLDIEVPKWKDSNKSNPSSEKTTGKEKARKALEEKGIVMPKSWESKQDPNELVINLSGDSKWLWNIWEVNQEKEWNPLGLVANWWAFWTNRRTWWEFSIWNENFLVKTEISDKSKAVSWTLWWETEWWYYWKVTWVVRQENVKWDYGKTDIHQYAVWAETWKKVFDNWADEVRVWLYGAVVTTESKTMWGSEREIIWWWQRTTISSKERFKWGNLWTVWWVVSYVNEQIRAQLSAWPTFWDRGPWLWVEWLLEYDLTEYLSLYAKGSSILGRQWYIEWWMWINVTDNVKVTAWLYHGEWYQSEDWARIWFVYEFWWAENDKVKREKTRVITPVAMTDLPYRQTIWKVEKEEKVSIENIMVPISWSLDAIFMWSNINIDLGTIFTGIWTNLEIQSYWVTWWNVVLTWAPTLTWKILTLNSNGLWFWTASLVIKDKTSWQIYKFDAYNYWV